MTENLTLVESSYFDKILEKAIYYDIFNEPNDDMVKFSPDIDWAEVNKQVQIRKENILSKYVNVPINLDETIEQGLERLGYE